MLDLRLPTIDFFNTNQLLDLSSTLALIERRLSVLHNLKTALAIAEWVVVRRHIIAADRLSQLCGPALELLAGHAPIAGNGPVTLLHRGGGWRVRRRGRHVAVVYCCRVMNTGSGLRMMCPRNVPNVVLFLAAPAATKEILLFFSNKDKASHF